MSNAVRGIRQSLPANVLLGRGNGKGGPAQAIPLSVIAQNIVASGAIPLPGGGGLITAVDSNFTVAAGTLELHTIVSGNLIANSGASTAEPASTTLTLLIDRALGSTEGQILQRGASAWQILAPGTAGQVLTSQGGSALNHWTTPASGTLTPGTTPTSGGSANTLFYDDGSLLQEATVGTGLSLSGGALTATGGGGGTTIGTPAAWNNAAAYSVGDTATYNGATYLCCAAVSAATFTPAEWANVSGMTISSGSNTDDTATSTSGASSNANATNVGKSTGKWYFEGSFSNLSAGAAANQFGLAPSGASDNAGGQASGTISGGGSGGGSGTFAGLSNSTRCGFCADLDTRNIWITDDVTSPNWNGTSASPSAGTGGILMATAMQSGTLYPNFYSASNAQVCVLHSLASDFTGPIPSGFTAWNTGSAASPNTSPDQDGAHWVGQGNVYPPGGRLSLTSGVAVQTADVSGGTSVYYVPYIHRGLSFLGLNLTSQLTLALDSNSGHTGYQQSGKLFDLFVYSDSGTLRLVTGPAWTNSTTRAQAIDQTTVLGLWTNTASMTAKFDTSSSTKTVAAGAGLYVGTMYASANGQCTVQFQAAAAGGGGNPVIGLYNAYNRVPGASQSLDNTNNWTYSTATWRSMNNSNSNRVSFIDGLGDLWVNVHVHTYGWSSVPANGGQHTGANLNSTSATPAVTSSQEGPATQIVFVNVDAFFTPALGFNYIQAMEFVDTGTTATSYGNPAGSQFEALVIYLEY